MRIHWFANAIENNISTKNLKKMVDYLDEHRYYSVLFAYHNQVPDIFLKLSNITSNQKIKFMVALRPRALSPEYFSMMVSSFNQITPKGLIVNIIHGSLSDSENEVGVIDDCQTFSSRDGILGHTKKFLKIIKQNSLFQSSNTELVVSGTSLDTIEIANNYADYWATDYRGLVKRKHFNGEKIMLSVDILILKDGESRAGYLNKYGYRPSNLKILFENEVLDFIRSLANFGVTDLMLSCLPEDKNQNRVHEFIKNNYDALLDF